MFTLPHKLSSIKLNFPNGQTAQAVQVQDPEGMATVFEVLELPVARPVLVIVGGASNLIPQDFDRLRQLFVESLAPLAQELNMVVVDGGTDAGVIKLMGEARASIQGTFPLVGIAPFNKIHYPHQPLPDTYPLEPHHTHFILTPGAKWGDESPWIAKIASQISYPAPSLTILINGGNVSLIDVQESIWEGRLVYVVEGTGRLADEIAAALHHPGQAVREALSPVIQSGLAGERLALFDLSKPAAQLTTVLKQYFLQGGDAQVTASMSSISSVQSRLP